MKQDLYEIQKSLHFVSKYRVLTLPKNSTVFKGQKEPCYEIRSGWVTEDIQTAQRYAKQICCYKLTRDVTLFLMTPSNIQTLLEDPTFADVMDKHLLVTYKDGSTVVVNQDLQTNTRKNIAYQTEYNARDLLIHSYVDDTHKIRTNIRTDEGETITVPVYLRNSHSEDDAQLFHILCNTVFKTLQLDGYYAPPRMQFNRTYVNDWEYNVTGAPFLLEKFDREIAFCTPDHVLSLARKTTEEIEYLKTISENIENIVLFDEHVQLVFRNKLEYHKPYKQKEEHVDVQIVDNVYDTYLGQRKHAI